MEALPFPTLDLNNPHHRKRFAAVLSGGSLLGILFAFVNYNAYLFTDSNTFCGKLCHRVMKPEYTPYLNGPHARVPCVDCHVGSGVSWFVKSKVSGVPQVFATLFHTYSTPIPVPLKNLRPSRETCEECHWPEKFYGAQLIQNPYFHYNEKNTPKQISLLMRTGGGTPNLGENAGIHWHMAINEWVYFRATDRQFQNIPWIQVVHSDGSVMIYKDREAKISDKELNKLPMNFMDCMDCHNRPSHIFFPPETALDQSMGGGNLSPKLPWIKKLSLDALVKNYGNQ
jgi:nitrate/TMAO reductase-like tetraheme cytochrome c subunit